ncbi:MULTISPECIES: FHA domain-containing protein [unclassified Mycobacterium]|uniref:FHA domain-containing protein n=1 Tax=unclassified Mycobacterium TaxID=2642494 RepID=UPI0029C7625A|nr:MULTISPECIES: FHA domain-containing protein [unclassified Mycobacterium]
MTRPEPSLEPGSLVVRTNGFSYVVSPRAGVATIGRDPHAQVKIDDARISRVHVRVEFVDGNWRAVDTSMNGMFLGSSRAHSVAVTDGLTVRLGDPVAGPTVQFDVAPTESRVAPDPEHTTLVAPDDDATVALHPGMVRAGAAAAARRRELDISQRSLAADGIINAGALIAFEKGRSWPRDRTRAKLEEVLQWPEGTIAQLRTGGAEAPPPTEPSVPIAVADEVPLIAQAVEAAVHTLGATIAALPALDDPAFTPRATAILTDLRQLEQVAARAARIGRVTPPLIKALSTVRRELHELTMHAAAAPTASLGQRVYATRRRANLTIAETAQAAGVPEDAIAQVEMEQPVSAPSAELIEVLLGQLE